MSALIFTDPHFHAHPAFAKFLPQLGYTSRVKEGLDTLDWLVDLACERDVDSVVCLGDVFHVPGFLDPVVAGEVQKRFQYLAEDDRQLVTIGGNHDVAGTHHSAISILPDTKVIQATDVLIIGLQSKYAFCVPWTKNLDPATSYAALQSEAPYMFGHFMCHDVEVATGHRVHGIDNVTPTFLDKFKTVLLGDAHKHQVVGNTTYLGSCLKNSFNDDGETAFAFIGTVLPSGEIGLEKIANPHSPYFLRLSTTVRPIEELITWIEDVVAKADPNGARVYLDLQATPKEAAKVQKKFGKTTLLLRVRPLVEACHEEKPAARIQTTSTGGPTDIVRKFVAAKAEDSPADPADLVRKGEEYLA